MLVPDKIIRQAISLAVLSERPGSPAEGESAKAILKKLTVQYGLDVAAIRASHITAPNTRWCVTCYGDIPISEFREVRVKGRRPYYLNFCRSCEIYRREQYAAMDKIAAEEPDLFLSWMASRFGTAHDTLHVKASVDRIAERYWEGPKKRKP